MSIFSLLFIVCAFVVSSSSDTTTTTPHEPRFCGISASENTTLNCQPVAYGQSVVHRSLSVIIISGLLFFIISTLLALPCCSRNFPCCQCIGNESTDEYKRYGNTSRMLGFIGLFVVLLFGVLCGLVANARSNVVLVETVGTLHFEYDHVNELSDNVTNVMANVSNYYEIPQDVQGAVKSGLSDVKSNIQIITDIVNKIGPDKDIFAAIASVWIILAGLVCIAYAYKGFPFLFYLGPFMMWCVLCGVCIFMTVMFSMLVVMNDACNELHYEPGLLDLVQSIAQKAYLSLKSSLYNGIDAVITKACDSVNNNCDKLPYLCPCNTDTWQTIPSRIVTDVINETSSTGYPAYAFVNRTVEECSTKCNNTDLRQNCTEFMHAVHAIQLIDSLFDQVGEMIVGFTGPTVRTSLDIIVCQTENISSPLWAGCVLLLIVMAGTGVILLVIDRALLCFEEDSLEKCES